MKHMRVTVAVIGLVLLAFGCTSEPATPDEDGLWWTLPGGRARVLPIASGHPAQVPGLHLYPWSYRRDRARPPTRAWHFQEGATIAWLVDFLAADGETIDHRVYVQTTSTGWPDGYFPPGVRDERPVDVALLAMDCANIKARGRRSIIDFLSAPVVIFCHWEDFFRPKTEPPREAVKVNLERLRAALPDTPETRYVFPWWGAVFTFPPGR